MIKPKHAKVKSEWSDKRVQKDEIKNIYDILRESEKTLKAMQKDISKQTQDISNMNNIITDLIIRIGDLENAK